MSYVFIIAWCGVASAGSAAYLYSKLNNMRKDYESKIYALQGKVDSYKYVRDIEAKKATAWEEKNRALSEEVQRLRLIVSEGTGGPRTRTAEAEDRPIWGTPPPERAPERQNRALDNLMAQARAVMYGGDGSRSNPWGSPPPVEFKRAVPRVRPPGRLKDSIRLAADAEARKMAREAEKALDDAVGLTPRYLTSEPVARPGDLIGVRTRVPRGKSERQVAVEVFEEAYNVARAAGVAVHPDSLTHAVHMDKILATSEVEQYWTVEVSDKGLTAEYWV